ncbi:hypothetical protein [uncultured Roseibium sp.]|uniref:hypothetical protein n=1 Tax=uncultured Roseibium sp. TaxID=1936171 RepID=UPI00262A33EC|nr:hypothetical protein [uncultured Roseibium sp.]
MPRSFEEDCARELRLACTTVIGFGQLLEDADTLGISQVKRLQYRAFLIGGALRLTNLVNEHHHVIADAFPGERTAALKHRAQEFRIMAMALDGHHQSELEKHAMTFGCSFLQILNR